MHNSIEVFELIKNGPYSTLFDKFSIETWKKINNKIFLVGPDVELQSIPELELTLELFRRLETDPGFEEKYIVNSQDQEYY